MTESQGLPKWNDYLFVGTNGHVVALLKKTGEIVWKTSLPKTGYSVVSIVLEENTLFCSTGGRVFALAPDTGEILWENPLKGMGTGLAFITTAASNNTEGIMALFSQVMKNQKAASSGSSGGS